MKKILLFLSCIVSVQLEAISIKDKIANLRKALAVHAQSETKTWELLEELDKRLAHIEARISQPPVSEAPFQPIPEAPSQAQPEQEQQRTHTLNRLRHVTTPATQQVDHSEAVQSPENQQNSEKISYFQQKAAYFDSLLNTLHNHVENNVAVTTTPIPQASEHTIMQDSDTEKLHSEPKKVTIRKRRDSRHKQLNHSIDNTNRSKRRLRHSKKPIASCPATMSKKHKQRQRAPRVPEASKQNSVHHINRSKKNHHRFKQHSMPLEEMQPVQPREYTLSRSYPAQY